MQNCQYHMVLLQSTMTRWGRKQVSALSLPVAQMLSALEMGKAQTVQ